MPSVSPVPLESVSANLLVISERLVGMKEWNMRNLVWDNVLNPKP